LRLLLKVKEEGFIIKIVVGSLLDSSEEVVMRPCDGRVFDHKIDGVVIFVIVGVKVDSL
jgi:hypothetical protein